MTKGSFLVAFCSNWTMDFGHDNSTAFAGITLISSAAASGVSVSFTGPEASAGYGKKYSGKIAEY
jgi:hypothetical protein